MGYIDAGYAAALVVLVVYGASLWFRRRRLEQLAVSVGLYEGSTTRIAEGANAAALSGSSPSVPPLRDEATNGEESPAPFGDEG